MLTHIESTYIVGNAYQVEMSTFNYIFLDL